MVSGHTESWRQLLLHQDQLSKVLLSHGLPGGVGESISSSAGHMFYEHVFGMMIQVVILLTYVAHNIASTKMCLKKYLLQEPDRHAFITIQTQNQITHKKNDFQKEAVQRALAAEDCKANSCLIPFLSDTPLWAEVLCHNLWTFKCVPPKQKPNQHHVNPNEITTPWGLAATYTARRTLTHTQKIKEKKEEKVSVTWEASGCVVRTRTSRWGQWTHTPLPSSIEKVQGVNQLSQTTDRNLWMYWLIWQHIAKPRRNEAHLTSASKSHHRQSQCACVCCSVGCVREKLLNRGHPNNINF